MIDLSLESRFCVEDQRLGLRLASHLGQLDLTRVLGVVQVGLLVSHGGTVQSMLRLWGFV